MGKQYGIGLLKMTQESAPGTEYQKNRPERRPIDYNPTYRQCADPECPAARAELPHSHLEEVPNAGVATVLHTDGSTSTVYPMMDDSPVKSWLSIPVEDIMNLVGNYITWVETAMTRDVCKCTKIPHPTLIGTWTGETALDCPAHSREGLVLGFFEWLKTHGR